MTKLHVLCVTVVTVLAFAAIASVAMAESEFLVNGEPIFGTEAKISASGEGTLLLEDIKGGIFGEKVDLLCNGALAASLESGSLLFVTSVTGLSCVTDAGICPEPELAFQGLPWHLEIGLVGTMFVATILGFEFGWVVACGKAVEDKCSAEEAKGEVKVLLENMEENDVLAEFAADTTPTMNCTRGGKGSTIIRESLLFAGTGGNVLAVS